MNPASLTDALATGARTGYAPDGALDRPALIVGVGVPDDTTDVGMVYINLAGATGDLVLYTWDSTAGVWDAMTA